MVSGAVSTRSRTASGMSRPVSKRRVLRRAASNWSSSMRSRPRSGRAQRPMMEPVVAPGEAQRAEPLGEALEAVLLGEADGPVELVGEGGAFGGGGRDPALGGVGVVRLGGAAGQAG